MTESWESIATRKIAARDALIPAAWHLKSIPPPNQLDVTGVPREYLSAAELSITEDYDATALAQAISQRKLKCVDVTRAFCKRAAIAQQLTNCLTEIMFTQALARAVHLDHHLEQYGSPVGPLHGVPISLKDTFRISGVDSCIGIASLAFKPSNFSSTLVTILINAGAVLYCKTNIPQTLMALDSVNNVFGRTLNPLNRLVTAGGSSGGEGALAAMKGSALGVGTDIGGSIRIPAACNGVYGLKPSANRVPYSGQQETGPPGGAAMAIQSRAGPIARSVRDCELFMRTVAAARPWETDPAVIPGDWQDMELSAPSSRKKLVFGILSTDNVMTPLPPIRNLLKEIATMLRAAGHTVVDLPTPPSFSGAQSLANALFSFDGGQHVFSLMNATKEPLIPWLAGRMKEKKPKSLHQGMDLHVQRERFSKEMLQQLWRAQDGGVSKAIDAIVCPIAPHPIPGIDRWGGVSYTSAWVLLDYCAGTVPVRRFTDSDIRGELDQPGEDQVLSMWDLNNRSLWNDPKQGKAIRKTYIGTPLSVQVVAPRLQERRLVTAMDELDRAVRLAKETGEGTTAVTHGGAGGAKL